MSGKGLSFSMGSKRALEQPGFSFHMGSTAARPSYGNIGKKRLKDEDDYFEEEDQHDNLEYLPGPDSPPSHQRAAQDDSDEDPLDAFMSGIEQEVATQKGMPKSTKASKKKQENIRDDIDEEDEEESFYRYMEENPNAGVIANDDDLELEYDADGNPIIPEKNKIIDPLPPIDHHEIDYPAFEKNFFEEHDEIKALTQDQVQDLRNKLGMRVTGISPPKPVSSFAHFGFDEKLLNLVRKSEFTQPTPIQAQGVPVALSGRDIIGIAKTGSGKTAAFLWPLLVHIMDQPELKPGDGPIGLICAPTRELSQQIYHEAKKFGKIYNIKVVCAYGGGSMWEQTKACQEGAEIIVCTPGRLIDLVKRKATNLQRVTYLVFDEADRMFDMGFEPQVRSIANQVRPDRQTLMFSATFKKKVERIARDILSDPVRVIQGDLGEANEDITQIVNVMQEGPSRWLWLTTHIVQFTSIGSVLIFVTKKLNAEELASNLKLKDFKLGLMHGDMSQIERNEVITKFKKKEYPILVATDVAARGLDIPSIKTVVNFDVARDIDTHTHRIGRTGRAGEKGTAYTLITAKDTEFAGHLVRNLESANQRVSEELMNIAMQVPWFKKNRFKKTKAKNLNIGGKGLGFRERRGLGMPSEIAGGLSSAGPKQLSSFSQYESTKGPQTDRVSSMREAFSAQFKSNFVVGSNSDTSFIGGGAPPPVKTKRKKTRWE